MISKRTEVKDKTWDKPITRLEKIRKLTAEEIAEYLIENNVLEESDPQQHFCKSDCEWANSMFVPDGECIKCCINWLNEVVADDEPTC